MTKTNPIDRQEASQETVMGVILLYGTLGKLLNHFPQLEDIKNIVQQDIFSELPFASDQPESEKGLEMLQKWSSQYSDSFTGQDFDELRADYTRLFIGPGKVLAPPWESVYYSEERLIFQEQTLKVREWYRRFGLESEKIHNEPDDHIGLELSFLAHLSALRLKAMQEKNEGAFNGYLKAQHQFLKQHPLKWAPLWCEMVDKHAQTDFYRGLALLTVGALKALDAFLAAEITGENA
jgi:putative dimethyl sulfoxide reductase chaperone